MIGRVLAGRYRIDSLIGEGGMARVYTARDLNTDRVVAVKVLRSEYRDDQAFLQRFEREAVAGSRLTQQNIVTLTDVGSEPDGTRYLVMEYISGQTLKAYIREKGAIRPDIAAQITMRILAALRHAHERGIIHRDIKPQNILIDRQGVVKVADFGIARITDLRGSRQDSRTVVGSVHYFSPEQARGEPAREKSDLYSVGVTFYEMLTGKVPFTGKTPQEIAEKHISEMPVPPSQINPAVPKELEAIVLKALAKKPEDRFASAEEMYAQIRRALDELDTGSGRRRAGNGRSKRRRGFVWTRRMILALFAVILLGALTLAGFFVADTLLGNLQGHIEMPNVIGMRSDAAVEALKDLGLVVRLQYMDYELIAQDLVTDQSPAAFSEVEAGDLVNLIVCKSRYTLRIPNVTGIMLADAQEMLERRGLKVGSIQIQPSGATNTMVIRQTPEADSPGNEGDEVSLIVSGGLIVMPKLTGETLESAEQTVIAYGLVLQQTLEQEVDDPSQVGRIIAQEPEPYAQVLPGSYVVMTLATASEGLIETDVEISVKGLAAGGRLIVAVATDEGSDQIQYNEILDGTEESILVTLYSQTRRSTYYSVYYDGEVVARYSVSFE